MIRPYSCLVTVKKKAKTSDAFSFEMLAICFLDILFKSLLIRFVRSFFYNRCDLFLIQVAFVIFNILLKVPDMKRFEDHFFKIKFFFLIFRIKLFTNKFTIKVL